MPPQATAFKYAWHQRGGAMLVMLVILVIGIATVFVTSLSGTAISNQRNNTTAEALARAKEALIGYAVTYGDLHAADTYGYLPCPDVDETGVTQEGIEHGNCGAVDVNTIGRFPWKSLDLPPLFDGTGECLWYAVSGNYKSNPKTAAPFNWDKSSLLHVYAQDGAEITPGEIVAVVIAPGSPVSGNSNRAGNSAPSCGGNYTAAAYLDNDTIHVKNNANGTTGNFIMPHEHRDANGNVTLSVNDQFIYITRQDIWYAIEDRIARDVRKCLDSYANSPMGTPSHKYPWAAPVSSGLYVGSINTLFGRIPDSPNINKPYTTSDPDVSNMLDLLLDLQAALDAYTANNNSTTRSALDNIGNDLKNVADDILDAGSYSAGINAVATPSKSAGSRAEHLADGDFRWNGSSWVPYTATDVQLRLDEANTALDALATPDSMQSTWEPAGCFSAKPYWAHWKELVFYQIAAGYKPGSSATCVVSGNNSCLGLQFSDQVQTGSGTYRAAVVIAGKKIGGGVRNVATVGDYLEAVNQTPMADNTQPYNTYRATDSSYQTINDRVICVDAGVNCN